MKQRNAMPCGPSWSWRAARRFWLCLALLVGVIAEARAASPLPTTIVFSLDEACQTSTGVFDANGSLIRTLWSKTPYYSAGSYSTTWDGLDDSSNAAPSGTYQIRLLEHNTEYVWDGAIGNTSAAPSGPTVHRGFYAIQDMAFAGSHAYYVSGYNEGKYGFRSFLTNDPQHVAASWFWDLDSNGRLSSAPGLADRSWVYATSDGAWVYFACPDTFNPSNQSADGSAGCVVACQVSDNSVASLSGGTVITNGVGDSFPNGIYVGSQPGLSGLSVQANGNLLAAAVAPDNAIYLMDKRSGALITNVSIPSPKRLSFSPDGSLWVISQNNVLCLTNPTSNSIASLSISTMSEPLDVAVSPLNPDLILVADGGGSQQVKAINRAGAAVWTYGLPGGYLSNGVSVTTNKFWFSYEGVDQTFVSFASDGSFWVGDEENHRVLHFSAGQYYLEQIMYQPHSYRTSADQNNPSRVFNQFLEFSVDYTKPLAQAWTLVANWKASVPTNYMPYNEGLHDVTTLSNGHTYALINNTSFTFAPPEVCELVSNGFLRLTGIIPLYSNITNNWITFGSDGSLRRIPCASARWLLSSFHGFDSQNNPTWAPEQSLASAPQAATDPVPRCCSGYINTAWTSGNIIVSYDSTLNDGWHLGGVRVGGTNWLWRAAPTGPLNGCGNYEIGGGLTYAGNTVMAADRNVVIGYHGEFFRGQGEAAQHMHFFDDGLFVGQFGECNIGHSVNEGAVPGFAGNGVSPILVKLTNSGYPDYYLWVNDESDHGPQRWHLVNARNIREQSGWGALGTLVAITNQAATFPVAVFSSHGTESAELSWNAVPGATSYNVRSSSNPGGPYTNFVGSSSGTNVYVQIVGAAPVFCVVTAMVGGSESVPSEQVSVASLDSTQFVAGAGSMAEASGSEPVVDLNMAPTLLSQPSVLAEEKLVGLVTPAALDDTVGGNLQRTRIGCQGYLIFDWGGEGTNLPSTSLPFTVTEGAGWAVSPFLDRQYRLGNSLGSNFGLMANLVGTISIVPSDDEYHYLTVACPAKFTDARNFTLALASTNGSSVQYAVNESFGYSHTFQFVFKGAVNLTASGPSGGEATVQALFFDGAPSFGLPPPTNLHIVSQ